MCSFDGCIFRRAFSRVGSTASAWDASCIASATRARQIAAVSAGITLKSAALHTSSQATIDARQSASRCLLLCAHARLLHLAHSYLNQPQTHQVRPIEVLLFFRASSETSFHLLIAHVQEVDRTIHIHDRLDACSDPKPCTHWILQSCCTCQGFCSS